LERLEFDCDFDLVEKIETILVDIDDEYPLISVYGKYDVIKTILEDLITDGFHIVNEIELEDYNVSYYDKEFILYVTEDGVNAEKAYYDDKYIYCGGNVSFVHEDCSSALLKYIESDKIYEFGYSDEDEEDTEDKYSDCDHNYTVNGQKVDKETFDNYVSKFAPDKVIKTNKESSAISTVSKEIFRVNGKKVTKSEYEKALSDIQDMCLDNMKDIMNEWRKLLRW